MGSVCLGRVKYVLNYKSTKFVSCCSFKNCFNMDFKMHIEKLEGTVNWLKCKRSIELVLRQHDIINGARVKAEIGASVEIYNA